MIKFSILIDEIKNINARYSFIINDVTCILTFPSSNLILNVENDAPIVGAISVGFMSQMYCFMRLLLPTPKKINQIHVYCKYLSTRQLFSRIERKPKQKGESVAH